jgi:hypothetical protein
MLPLPPTSRGSVSFDGSQGEMTCTNTLIWMVSIGSHVDGDGDGDLFHQMVKLYSQITKSMGRACWWRCWWTLRAALVLHRGCQLVLCSICCWAGNQKLLQPDRAITLTLSDHDCSYSMLTSTWEDITEAAYALLASRHDHHCADIYWFRLYKHSYYIL